VADDQEKTEEATSKKIEDARKEGNVPKSQDTSAFITLVVALGAFLALLPLIESRTVFLYHYYQSLIGTEITKEVTFQISMISFREIIFMVIPLALSCCYCRNVSQCYANRIFIYNKASYAKFW
jgi:flagellar biosynthesis protein FlhB